MANQKISDLTQASPLQDADMIPVVQIENSVPVTKKTTISDIKSAIGGDFLPLDGSKHMTGNLIFANNFNENLNQGIVWYTSDAMSSITSPDHFSIVIDAADSGNIILTTDEGDVTVDNRVDKFNINSDNFNVNSNNFNVKCDISVNTNFTLTRGTHNDILHQDDHYTYLSNSHGDDLLTSYYYGTSVVDNTVCLSRGYNDVLSQSKQWTFLSNSQGNDLLTSYYDGVTTANNQLTISRGGANDVLIQYKNDTLLSDSNGGDLLGSSISNGTGTQYNNVNLFASGDPVISAQRDSSHTENSTVTFSRCGYNDVLSQGKTDTTLNDSNGDNLLQSAITNGTGTQYNDVYLQAGGNIINAHYDSNHNENNSITISRCGNSDVLNQGTNETNLIDSNGYQVITAWYDGNTMANNTLTISRGGASDALTQTINDTKLISSYGSTFLTCNATSAADANTNVTLKASNLTFDVCPAATTASAVYIKGTDGKLKTITLTALKALLASA